MILIVSTVADAATDAVIHALSAKGASYYRVNTEDYPFDRTITVEYESEAPTALVLSGTAVQPKSIWYRRVRSAPVPPTMQPGIYDFCIRENRAALIGGVLTQSARWMNHPTAVWGAEFKPYQLRVAQHVGLRIPKTVVSNDPESIRRAFHKFGPLIVKPVRSGYVEQGGEAFSIFTSKMTYQHLDELESAKLAPSIYQEWIRKEVDVRVTIVGNQVFAAAIHSQTDPDAIVDWRQTKNPQLPHSRLELPSDLVNLLREFQRRLGLTFGCIDMVLTPAGEYIFLEVNPGGQWLWLDDQLDLGISASVADWLHSEGTCAI
jgi:glutathione synthase/RimK-type ligase-like ATP-grasp enzyme